MLVCSHQLLWSFIITAVPMVVTDRTSSTYTVTDARILHPSMTHYQSHNQANMATTTVTTNSSNARYGIISRLGSSSPSAGITGLLDLPSSPPKSSLTPISQAAHKTETSDSHVQPMPTSSSKKLKADQTMSSKSPFSANQLGAESISTTPNNTTDQSKQRFGILSNFYQYLTPGQSTSTTQSGLTSIVSDQFFGANKSSATRSAYGRWQSPW